jgi:hypothetical protein
MVQSETLDTVWYTFRPKNARNDLEKAVFRLILRRFLTENRSFLTKKAIQKGQFLPVFCAFLMKK